MRIIPDSTSKNLSARGLKIAAVRLCEQSKAKQSNPGGHASAVARKH
jgi:hypothetical protein